MKTFLQNFFVFALFFFNVYSSENNQGLVRYGERFLPNDVLHKIFQELPVQKLLYDITLVNKSSLSFIDKFLFLHRDKIFQIVFSNKKCIEKIAQSDFFSRVQDIYPLTVASFKMIDYEYCLHSSEMKIDVEESFDLDCEQLHAPFRVKRIFIQSENCFVRQIKNKPFDQYKFYFIDNDLITKERFENVSIEKCNNMQVFVNKNEWHSLLCFLIQDGHIDIARYLIEKGINVNKQNIFGNTALMYAIRVQDVEMVKYLLENGADPNVVAFSGDTPLIWSTCDKPTRSYEITKILLENGADPNVKNDDDFLEGEFRGYTPLHCCAFYEDLKIPKLLLNYEADAHIRCELARNTALIKAANENNLGMVKLLINYGSDVNVKNEWGESALMTSVFCNNYEMTKFLLECGADVNVQSKDGTTPLFLAVDHNNYNYKLAKLLVDYGANVNVVGNCGYTMREIANCPLIDYVNDFCPDSIKRLINKKSQKNVDVLESIQVKNDQLVNNTFDLGLSNSDVHNKNGNNKKLFFAITSVLLSCLIYKKLFLKLFA